MTDIEKSIDTLGYQVRDKTNPSKLAARVYALRDRTSQTPRFVLYELNVNWPFQNPFQNETNPVAVIGESRSFRDADIKLKKYLSEKFNPRHSQS